jgi:methylglutaconyl-CoA hydratase
MDYKTLSIRRDGFVEHVTLNRPDVRNAFNPQLIHELTVWAGSVGDRPDVRVAVLSGAGKTFSAGADLAWMAETARYTQEENLHDARRLAWLFESLDTLAVPLVGLVHGAALGGGAGLVAVCDIVIAEQMTVFGFTEVKLGIVPAAIAPYVIAKIGRSAVRELFLTGARFSAAHAQGLGLVHRLAAADQMETAVAEVLAELASSGPGAMRVAKRLIRELAARSADDVTSLTSETIAARRVSAEGQEGLRAFLEKRPPKWVRST